jgi:hypothetical protein
MATQQQLLDGFDAFQADMQAAQAAQGVMPTPATNRNQATSLFNEMEQKGEFNVVADAPATEQAPDVIKLRDGTVVDVAEEREDNYRPLHPETLAMLARYRFLFTMIERGPMGQPSWHDRAVRVQRMFKPDSMQRFSFELLALLDESDAYWGSWREGRRGIKTPEGVIIP